MVSQLIFGLLLFGLVCDLDMCQDRHYLVMVVIIMWQQCRAASSASRSPPFMSLIIAKHTNQTKNQVPIPMLLVSFYQHRAYHFFAHVCYKSKYFN